MQECTKMPKHHFRNIFFKQPGRFVFIHKIVNEDMHVHFLAFLEFQLCIWNPHCSFGEPQCHFICPIIKRLDRRMLQLFLGLSASRDMRVRQVVACYLMHCLLERRSSSSSSFCWHRPLKKMVFSSYSLSWMLLEGMLEVMCWRLCLAYTITYHLRLPLIMVGLHSKPKQTGCCDRP